MIYQLFLAIRVRRILFDLRPQGELWPAVAREKPDGTVVRERSEITHSWIHDLPLPAIVCRRRIALITLVDNGLCTQRTRQWPVPSDIVGSCPQTICASRRCAVTMAFVEWLDRRRRLRLYLQALRRDVFVPSC